MFTSIFADVIPRAVVASAIAWGGANYVLIGPKLAERVVAADYLPACTANIQALAAKAGEEKLASIPLPTFDPASELALRQVEGLLDGPLMNWARDASQGMERMIGLDIDGAATAARQQHEAGKRAAEESYRKAKERVREQTASRLAAAVDLCSCIGNTAIAETRTEWAIFTGTLAFYTPAAVEAFDNRMGSVAGRGVCEKAEGASS